MTSILQDHLGFLWFGTFNGLVRYDGVSFQTYKPISGDEASLGGRFVFSMLEDRHGDLWVGTRRGGLSRYDRARDRFVRYRPDPKDPDSLASESVAALIEDRQGRIWVGTGDLESDDRGLGLDVLDPETGKFRHFQSDPDDESSLAFDNVTSLLESEDGSIWVGTLGGGLDRFDPESETFTHHRQDRRNPRSISSDLVAALDLAPDGAIWVATLGGGVNRLDPETGYFRRFQSDGGGRGRLANDWVLGLHVDRKGQVWAGNWKGALHSLDQESGLWRRYENDPDESGSLTENAAITDILEDRSGILWVATADSGLDRMDPYGIKFPYFRHEPGNENSLVDGRISVLLDDAKGRTWIGTEESGLDLFDTRADRITHFLHDPEVPGSLASSSILSLLEDHLGAIWIGTGGGGLLRFDEETSTFVRIRRDEGRGRVSKGDYVFSILEDRDGILWLGTRYGGLTRFDPERDSWSRYSPEADDADTLGQQLVSVQIQDGDGILWLGTDGGLQRFDPETGVFETFFEPLTGLDMIHSLLLDSQDRLWVGTFNGGLHLFDREQGSSVALTELDGLANDTIYGILEDQDGALWLSTGNGISRYDPEDGTIRNYGAADGLRAYRFSGGAVLTRGGQMLFGSRQGLNAFFPEHVKDNPFAPQVALTDFRVFYQSVAPEDGGSLTEHVSVADRILLTHHENVISFGFAALHYSDPERNTYAFRLDPIDSDWHRVGNQRSATFTNLAPGDYVFRVKAANPDGLWNEEGTSIQLRILPPWWKAWWALTLYGLGLVFALVGGARYQRARVVKRERALAREQQAELRTEAAELQAKAAEAQARALQAENDRKGLELEEARKLQISMLPEELPCPPGLEIAASMHTATEVGGDYYDFDLAPDGTLTVAIGDATGHGIKAGTMVTATKALFSLLARDSDNLDFMKRSTRVFKRMQLDNLFMALSLLRFRDGRVEAVGAGMPPVYILRKRTGQVEEIRLEGAPLGSFVDFPYSRSVALVEPGDSVVLMSDGLPEMLDPETEMLGYERVTDLVGELGDMTPGEAVSHLESAALEWAGGRDRADDMTLIVIRSKG